jgi:hypothetical protein
VVAPLSVTTTDGVAVLGGADVAEGRDVVAAAVAAGIVAELLRTAAERAASGSGFNEDIVILVPAFPVSFHLITAEIAGS